MIKILLFLLIPIILFLLIFITKQPQPIYDQIFGRVLGEHTIPSTPPIPNPLNLIPQTENMVRDATEQASNDLKDSLHQTLQNSLNQVLGQQPIAEVTQPNNPTIQIANSTPPATQPISIIDLAKDSNIKIYAIKNSKYYLQFQNTPPNNCLYLNGNKYPINNNQTIEIQISTSGTYPISINSCNLSDKNIGEISVQ